MALSLVQPPAEEPVSLRELRDFILPDEGEGDALLSALGIAAREWCETYTARRFVTQTWNLKMDFFPGYIDLKMAGQKVSSPFVNGSNAVLVGIRYAIVLPYPKVQSISKFCYLGPNGNTITMADGVDYTSDLASQPARLTPPFGRMWPVARVVVNAVEVEYICGYGTAAEVPQGIKTAIKMLAAHWWENRLAGDVGIPQAVKTLLMPFRDLRLG